MSKCVIKSKADQYDGFVYEGIPRDYICIKTVYFGHLFYKRLGVSLETGEYLYERLSTISGRFETFMKTQDVTLIAEEITKIEPVGRDISTDIPF